jgi:hypothetical protein
LRYATAATLMLAVAAQSCVDLGPKAPPADVPGDTIRAVPTCDGGCRLTWSPDSKVLFVTTSSGLYIVNPESGAAERLGAIGLPSEVVSTPTGDGLVYSLPEGTGKFAVHELTVATRATRRVVTASSAGLTLAPDGRTLAYHPEGATGTADSVVVIDLVSRGRLGSMGGSHLQSLAFSDDGAQLAVWYPAAGGAQLRIWNVATGSVEATSVPSSTAVALHEVAWVEGSFRALIRSSTRLTETDHRLVPIAKYDSLPREPVAISWVPAQHAAFVALPGKCYETDGGWDANCTITAYGLSYVAKGAFVTPGSVNAASLRFGTMRASPDGRWLAHVNGVHVAGTGYKHQLFILRNVALPPSPAERQATTELRLTSLRVHQELHAQRGHGEPEANNLRQRRERLHAR